MSMNAQKGISPSRQYRVSMLAEDETQVQETITLPAGLVNNAATVELWYQKHVPAGHLIVEVEPVETIPVDVVEEDDESVETIPVDVVEEDDEPPYKDEDEPFVELWPVETTNPDVED